MQIGIDILPIKRVKRAREMYGERFISFCFNKGELPREYNDATLAGKYAAKEAVLKALKVGVLKEVAFLDISIIQDRRGAPEVLFDIEVKKKYRIASCSISITHDQQSAIAVAVILFKH